MIYLNHAATSWPKAPGVIQAMTTTLEAPPVHPGRAAGGEVDLVASCRLGVARLLGVDDPCRVILTTNATHALNLAIWGLRLENGDLVVTTAAEHNSVLRPLRARAERGGIRVVVVPTRPCGAVDESALAQAVDHGARLVAMTHASNVTGAVNDVASVFAHAKRAGALTLLDASQTVGHLPVRPIELGADLVAFTGHKAIGGPPGTGGLYCASGVDLDQWLVGGTGVRSELLDHPTDMPLRLEAGTPNVPALAGLRVALGRAADRLVEDGTRVAALAARLMIGLQETKGVEVFGTGRPSPVGIASFRIDRWEVEEAAFVLERSFGIVSRAGLHCAPLVHAQIGSAPGGTVRFSLGATTTEAEVDEALAAVRRLAS